MKFIENTDNDQPFFLYTAFMAPHDPRNPEPKEPQYDNSKRVLDVWQPKWIRDKYFDGRENPNHGSRTKR